ncbi:MAG: TolC family protein [Methylococcales bacterium]|nr:TolC family protein [Methylococcales bacterium]
MEKGILKKNSWQIALILSLSTTGCSYYFNGSGFTPVTEKVTQRIENKDEGVVLSQISKKPPETVEQAMPKFKERSVEIAQSPAKSIEKAEQKEFSSLTIANIRALTLENNLDLKIAEIDPKIASTQVSEEEAKFDDLIFAKAKYGRKDTPKQNLDVVTFTPTSGSSLLKNETDKLTAIEQLTQVLDMEAGVVIPLRTAAKVTLSSPFDEKKQFKGVQSTQYQNALRFSISQPLLRDGGIDANVAGIRIAKYEQQAIDVKTRLQAIRVLAVTERAYWQVYQAWGELDVRHQQYENAVDNLEMVKKRVANGMTAAIETNRADIGVAERREALITANTTLKIRQRQLKLLLNDAQYPLDSKTLIVPQTTPMLLHFDFEREELVQKALSGRLELLELELKLAADLTKIDYLKNQTLPLFMLDYNYGSLGRDTDSFDGAFNQSIDGIYSDWSVGMRVEIPLSNELRKSKLERAVQERLQRLSTQQLRELTVKREIYDALDTTEQNWQRILAARQNVILAGLNYDAELKQFREGLRTMTEVLETLTRLGDAQLREVRAISDYQVSLIDLAFATGTLLGYSHVK